MPSETRSPSKIPKENGKTRKLGIPTAVDRVIQQAIVQVLTPSVVLDCRRMTIDFFTLLRCTLNDELVDNLPTLGGFSTFFWSSKYFTGFSENPQYTIKKAIIFPVNKESHALLRFKDRLKFDIAGTNERLSGKVGKRLLDKK